MEIKIPKIPHHVKIQRIKDYKESFCYKKDENKVMHTNFLTKELVYIEVVTDKFTTRFSELFASVRPFRKTPLSNDSK